MSKAIINATTREVRCTIPDTYIRATVQADGVTLLTDDERTAQVPDRFVGVTVEGDVWYLTPGLHPALQDPAHWGSVQDSDITGDENGHQDYCADKEAAEEVGTQPPGYYVSLLRRMSTHAPTVPPPDEHSNRNALENWCKNTNGGGRDQAWVDEHEEMDDDPFYGLIYWTAEQEGYVLDAPKIALRDIYLASQYYVAEATAEPLVVGGATHL